MIQESWKKKPEEIISNIPEVFEDDPEKEKERSIAIQKFRNTIADRWVAVRNIAAQSHAAEYDELVLGTKRVISEIVSAYGAELPFAPFPDVVFAFPDPVALGMERSVVEFDHDDVPDENHSTSSKKSRSSSTSQMLPHEYRFISTKEDKIWTCLVVAW